MKICVVSGSRADEGMLAWPIKRLKEEGTFEVCELSLHGVKAVWDAEECCHAHWRGREPAWAMMLGDRWEILGSAIVAHLLRIPIAHLAGGDQTAGSYDEAMRDCISRLATLHFVTNEQALARLRAVGYAHVHLVGSTGIDYIKHGDWPRERPYPEPYVVVSYQPETIDGTNEIEQVLKNLPTDKRVIFIMPNLDRGSADICVAVAKYCHDHAGAEYRNDMFDLLPHGEFLNLLAHCDEFIGNSSAIFYEAPVLGIPTRLIGKRQQGRVRPWGDGQASERIVKILKDYAQEVGVA